LAAPLPPPLPSVVRLPTSGSAPSSSSSAAQPQINNDMNAWRGMQVLYLHPKKNKKKKKKKKMAAEISEDEAATYLMDEGQISEVFTLPHIFCVDPHGITWIPHRLHTDLKSIQ
jgi:hypothetical protein